MTEDLDRLPEPRLVTSAFVVLSLTSLMFFVAAGVVLPVVAPFAIGPLGHWFLARLHLGVGGVDPEPQATVGE